MTNQCPGSCCFIHFQLREWDVQLLVVKEGTVTVTVVHWTLRCKLPTYKVWNANMVST